MDARKSIRGAHHLDLVRALFLLLCEKELRGSRKKNKNFEKSKKRISGVSWKLVLCKVPPLTRGKEKKSFDFFSSRW